MDPSPIVQVDPFLDLDAALAAIIDKIVKA
jgi:hypothetical protein